MSAASDTVTFRPSGPLRGRVRVPGDKSITQRALLIGAVCDGPVEIVEPVWAGDPLATAGMVTALGVAIDGLAGRESRAVVRGAGLRGLRAPAVLSMPATRAPACVCSPASWRARAVRSWSTATPRCESVP